MDFALHFLLLLITITIPLLLILQALKKSQSPTTSDTLVKDADHRLERQKLTINAYERLALLCDRIQPDKLSMRLQTNQLTADDLSQILIVAIQQEFDHNITQQIFVSESLWNIINLAKEEALYQVIEINASLPADAPAKSLTEALMKIKDSSQLNTAAAAIRTEAKIHVKI
ncbi:MAG: hypothetical protein ABI761_05580 [Saprospiraceae bacterium]